MARGNERDKARAKNAKKAAANGKSAGSSGGGQNKVKQDALNAQRLADKIAKKAKLKSEGKLKEKNKGSKAPQKGSGGAVMVNPHTGKKDAAWTAKHGKKK